MRAREFLAEERHPRTRAAMGDQTTSFPRFGLGGTVLRNLEPSRDCPAGADRAVASDAPNLLGAAFARYRVAGA